MTIAAHRLLMAAAACAVLGACGQADPDPGPGAVSVGEATALEQAAEMLEEQRLPAEAQATAEQVANEEDQGLPPVE